MTSKQAIVSPRPADTFAFPSMGFLTSCYNGGKGKSNAKKSRSNSIFFQRRRVIDAKEEPTSPRVTCVGQVKVKSAKTTSSSSSSRQIQPLKPSRSKSSSSSTSVALLIRKFESLFETVCCVGPGRTRRDDRIRRLEDSAGLKLKSEIVRTGPNPTAVLKRSRGVSSVVTRRLFESSLPSAPRLETEDSGFNKVRKGSGDEEYIEESENLKPREIGGSDETETSPSEAEAVAVVKLRRCNSDPGRIRWRTFASDPDIELGGSSLYPTRLDPFTTWNACENSRKRWTRFCDAVLKAQMMPR